MHDKNYDFGGWATRNNLKCSDGRTIMENAFQHNDGERVPLVWMHQHHDPLNVLGHAELENRKEGVYAYCSFNETEYGRAMKEAVKHGDISALSIYANNLKQQGSAVLHGAIREVSLVISGANPGAKIDSIVHGEYMENEAIITTGETIELFHAEQEDKKDEPKKEESKKTEKEETIQDVVDSMNEKQKAVLEFMVGAAAVTHSGTDNDSEGGENMKKNVFAHDAQTETNNIVMIHSEMQGQILADAKRYGTLKESFLAHAGEIEYAPETQDYGFNGVDFLLPDPTTMDVPPTFIQREMGWVSDVMNGVHRTPFSRIKSIFADITEDEARAKGYIKGKYKKEEVFSLLKRTTTPTTVYKKQKMDRDDVIDITSFSAVAWIKAEMRMMLDEEIARAILVGDGRLASDDDHINETNIRPVWKDEDLFTIKSRVVAKASDSAEDRAKMFIKNCIKSRKNYRGSGNPVMFMDEDLLTDCLLIEDATGRCIYEDEAKLAKKLRVSKIVTVPVMEGLTRETTDGKTLQLLGIMVNLKDYNLGADKGGAVNMFDDFDIDYNALKYLIETRCSGALTKPYAAIAIELEETA